MRSKIEATAQVILDARALYPESSLADLYDEVTMPPELRRAHQNNDRAVMEAYGFDWRKMTESECVAELFKLYQKLVDAESANSPISSPKRRGRGRCYGEAMTEGVGEVTKPKRTRKKKTKK